LLLGMLYVFIEGMTTLSSVIFLVSGEHKLASVAIFHHANSGEFGFAAAKAVVILAVALIAMGLVWFIETRTPRRGLTQRAAMPAAAGGLSDLTLGTAARNP
jgi:iron(III) transport system permease protein